VRDVRATFRDRYAAEALRRLDMPVLLVVGSRSPEITFKIAGALSSLAPRGSLVKLDEADHALTTSHPEAVADLIARLAAHG
jgi:pimeloyl-ACP methyl ester carboxylesterase